MKKIRSLLVLIALLSAVGCTVKFDANEITPAAHNIVGEWEYTLTASDGNVYDNGTIEFTGDPNQGNWTLLNFYKIEYSGTYTVNGNTISLVGDENRDGSFVDATHITGQWQNDEADGEWTAVKK
jgi:hypothetical protein